MDKERSEKRAFFFYTKLCFIIYKPMDRKTIGSITAKGGFAHEKLIAQKFNNYRKDKEAQFWLACIGYEPSNIKDLQAIVVPTRISLRKAHMYGLSTERLIEELKFKKSDVQLRLDLLYENVYFVENISVKKANSDADYNQVDKRRVSEYKAIWAFDDEIEYWLKLFTGELTPPETIATRDKRRLFFDEMPESVYLKIANFFRENKLLVVSDVIKGRGSLSADWFMVARYDKLKDETTFAIADINIAMNFFGEGEVNLSPKGSLYIGRITMQRKGGTPDPTKLQFKIKPCSIFEVLKRWN